MMEIQIITGRTTWVLRPRDILAGMADTARRYGEILRQATVMAFAGRCKMVDGR